jgi:hypothetical protein
VSAGNQPSTDALLQIADLRAILDDLGVVARGLGAKRFSPTTDLTE